MIGNLLIVMYISIPSLLAFLVSYVGIWKAFGLCYNKLGWVIGLILVATYIALPKSGFFFSGR